MIKFIATDVDGTLVKSGSLDIDPAYFEAIEKLKAMGITIAVCSGRSEDSLVKLFTPVMPGLYFVSNNGANVIFEGKAILNEKIDWSLAHKIANDIYTLPNCSPLFSTRDKVFYSDRTEEACLDFCRGYSFNMFHESEMDIDTPINKVCTYYSGRGKHPANCFINSYKNVTAFYAGDGWMDFVPKQASKGNAISRIMEICGANPSEAICFGDQENDISMFAHCKYNVAVEGASEVCLRAAKYHTDSYQNLGVLKILEKIIKGQEPFEE